ncbi:hypothetical protein QOZ80_2AG0129530 [Eleusine coracana subsp. coracana]|nr:hypothetical protein QOZ80_2AG0129530 [Eleusine coracana subsp. coracana]
MASAEPFNRLVKLMARAFYDSIPMKGDNQPKNFRGDNSGMGVVVLDALTRRQWVREEDLAKALKLHSKQLRRILRFFEEEKLITRVHRKESAKAEKAHNSAAAAASGQPVAKEDEEKQKMHTHSYCCLDYAQICDVVRYRIHRMKKKLKDDLDSRNTIQHYICRSCNKRYSAFDALQLVSYTDYYFHCETCNGELVAMSDKLASGETGDGEDNARKCRSDKLKDMLQRIDEQLKPLVAQLEKVKKLPAPEFGSLQSWERARSDAFANGCPGATDSSMNSTTGPGNGFEVIIDPNKDVDVKDDPGKDGMGSKPMPPWLKEGKNLSEEQRGQIPSKLNEISETKDGNKQKPEDEKTIEDEYIKAYYEAWGKQEDAKRRMQHEGEIFISNSQSDRKVGMKYKWEDEDEGIEWKEDQATGCTAEANKLEADEDDGYEWVDG